MKSAVQGILPSGKKPQSGSSGAAVHEREGLTASFCTTLPEGRLVHAHRVWLQYCLPVRSPGCAGSPTYRRGLRDVSSGDTLLQTARRFTLMGADEGFPRQYQDTKVDEKRAGLTSAFVALGITSATVLAGLVWISTPWLPSIFEELRLPVFGYMLALAVLGLGARELAVGGFRARLELGYRALWADIVPWSTIALSVVGVGWMTRSTDAVITALCLVTAALGLPAMLHAWRHGVLKLSVWPRSVDLRGLFAFSWPLLGTVGISQIIRRLDLLLLGMMVGPEEVAIYSAALAFAWFIDVVRQSALPVALPLLTSALRDNSLRRRDADLVGHFVLVITVILAVPLIILSREVLGIAFGSSYETGALCLAVLSIAMTIRVLVGLTGPSLVAIGKPKLTLLNTIIAASFGITTSILLIPSLGSLGAALGAVLGASMRSVAEGIESYLYLKRSPLPSARAFIAVCMGVLLGALTMSVLEIDVATRLAALLAAEVVIAVLAWRSLPNPERVEIRAFVAGQWERYRRR